MHVVIESQAFSFLNVSKSQVATLIFVYTPDCICCARHGLHVRLSVNTEQLFFFDNERQNRNYYAFLNYGSITEIIKSELFFIISALIIDVLKHA